MFKMFRSPLSAADPATVVTVFVSSVIKQFNYEMLTAARREVKPDLFEKIHPTTYHNLLACVFAILFGRLLARMDAHHPEVASLGLPIRKSPSLLPNDPYIRKMIELTLCWAEDEDGARYVIEGVDNPSVWRIAFFTELIYVNGGGDEVESRFRNVFSKQLSEAGYSNDSIRSLNNTYTSNLDSTIDTICKQAEDVWLEIPSGERDRSKEYFASVNASVVSELNRMNTYSVLFQEILVPM